MDGLKVIATNITNLTDARYFAAHGVDYLLYDLDQISPDAIAEINEWVSGPSSLVLLGEDSIHMLDEVLLRIQPAYFALHPGTVFDISHILPFYEVFHIIPGNSESEMVVEDKLYLPLPKGVEDIFSWARTNRAGGIILKGGSEMQTGIKTYEALDIIFEKLCDG